MEMQTYKKNAKVVYIEQLNCSKSWNPRYELILNILDNNENIKVWTESDASFGYSITNWMLNKIYDCELVDKRNRIYIVGAKNI